MNFLSQQASDHAIAVIAIVGIVLLGLLSVWAWKKFSTGKGLRDSGNSRSLSAKSLAADQFVFDDDANELQSRLEAELSRQDSSAKESSVTQTAQQNTGSYHTKKARGIKQTKLAIGLATDSDNASISADADKYAKIDKVELARLVSAVESLKHHNQQSSELQPTVENNGNTTLVDAEEIERLSFHLESSNREIASLRQELTNQTHRIALLEQDTPDTLLRDSHKKITLLANSIIQRNAGIEMLAEDYKNSVILAAQLAKSDPKQSQLRMQQCNVIKLKIKLQGQQLEKERLLMSEHTRVHRAMQLPKEKRAATLMQLVEQTNEIKTQNTNLKLLVDNINVEFGQLRTIVAGLKASVVRNQAPTNARSNGSSGFDKKFDQGLAEKRLAANDARIAAAGASPAPYAPDTADDKPE